jgi:hypothetical protein
MRYGVMVTLWSDPAGEASFLTSSSLLLLRRVSLDTTEKHLQPSTAPPLSFYDQRVIGSKFLLLSDHNGIFLLFMRRWRMGAAWDIATYTQIASGDHAETPVHVIRSRSATACLHITLSSAPRP